MKNIFKSKLFWVILVIIIVTVAVLIYRSSNGKDQNVYTTQKVERSNLKQTVSATGKIKSAEEIELSFETNGRLAQINVDNGDIVEPGTIIATLQAGDLASRVTKAQATLSEARARLNKIVAGSTAEEIEVSKAAVAKARTDLNNAKVDLEDTKLTNSQAINNAKEDAITESEKAITKAEISLNIGNDIIENDDYDSNLSVQNMNYLISANTNYSIGVGKITVAKNSNAKSKIEYNEIEVVSAINDTLDTLDVVSSYLSDISGVLSNSITGIGLSQATLDLLKTDINTQRTTNDSSKASVLAVKQAFNDSKLDYTTLANDAQATVDAYNNVLAKVQAELDLELAAARKEDINLYQAQVNQAQADLIIANQNLSKTKLIAPTQGIVTDVKNEVGERVGEIDIVVTMLASGPFEIEVNIPESDIAKVHLTDRSEITLDAFTDDIILAGAVIMINPAQTEIQDVIYYKVTVSLDDNQAQNVLSYMEQIKPGMTANIDILTAIKENVIVIPQRAVKTADDTIVQILKNGQPNDIVISLGLRGDEGMVEVVSGLEEGQEVITFIKEKK